MHSMTCVCNRSERPKSARPYRIEPLESRQLLASIVWANRGSGANDSDNFASVFGVNANVARSVVDAAIASWQNVIVNFHYTGGGNTYTLNLSMDTSGTSSGAGTVITHTNSNGAPDGATIKVGRGADTTGDGIGDGGGYYLNNNPYSLSTWVGTIDNAFVSVLASTDIRSNESDLYSVVLHEIGHAMGLSPTAKLKAISTDTGAPDTVSGPIAGQNNNGNFWAVHGTTSHALFTGFNSGGNTSSNSSDAGGPIHFAFPPTTISYAGGGATYYGAYDLMNPTYSNGTHYLISDQDANILADAYGYTITTPDSLGTFYDYLKPDGTLQITGTATGDNQITVGVVGQSVVVSLDLGTPVGGADPTNYFTSYFNLSSVTSIHVIGNGGNDTVTIGQTGTIPVTVDGNGGNNVLYVTGASGTTTLSNHTIIGGSQNLTENDFTTLYLTGSAGNDTFNLYYIPDLTHVTISGGGGDDTLDYGQGTDYIHQSYPILFDGGSGTNTILIDNTTAAGPDTEEIYSTYFLGYGGLVVSFTNTQNIIDLGGPYDDRFYLNSLNSGTNVTIFGSDGNDTLYMGSANVGQPQFSDLKGRVNFYGGAGTDSVQLSDRLVAAARTYNVFANSATLLSDVSGTLTYDATTESVELDGPEGYGSTYNINSTAAGAAIVLSGGLGNDTFNVTAATGVTYTLAGAVQIIGGCGTNVMYYTESGYSGTDTESILLSQTDIEQDTNQPVKYSQIGSLVITGPALNLTYYILGTSPDITGQTTIFCGNGNNTIYVFPHDQAGNLTIASSIGIAGQGGVDSLKIGDQGSAGGIHYVLSNPFGAGTEDIAGMGTGLVGAGSDIQNLSILCGDGNDIIDVNSFMTGQSLTINGYGGNDTVNITPAGQSLSAGITNISAFTFDGGDGFNSFNLYDGLSSSSWTYTLTSTNIQADKTSYHLTLNISNVLVLYVTGSPQADLFNLQSNAAYYTNLDGLGGADIYNLGLSNSVQNISGAIYVAGDSADVVNVNDSADIVGRHFHVDTNLLSARLGDNLFPSTGYLDVASGVRVVVNLGSGADTVSAMAGPSQVTINANNPTTGAGDSVSLALANCINPVIHTVSSTSLFVTSDTLQQLSVTGFETITSDAVAPTVVAAGFDPNAVAPVLAIGLSKPLAGDPTVSALQLQDISAVLPATIPAAYLAETYNAAAQTMSVTFPGFTNGVLPAGVYSAVISATTLVSDIAGNLLPADFVYDFLTIPAAGRLSIAPDRGTISINQLDIQPTGVLDLSQNALILRTGGEAGLAKISQLIQAGLQNVQTPGPAEAQIISSAAGPLTALGTLLSDGGDFNSLPTAAGDVLVKYTYVGDTNLDGVVDGSDYSRIDNGYLTGATGWANGDFNYDNVINGSDYTLIDNAYNMQATPLAVSSPGSQLRRQARAFVPSQTFSSQPIQAFNTAPVADIDLIVDAEQHRKLNAIR